MSEHKRKTHVAVYIRIGGSGDTTAICALQRAHFTAMVDKAEDWELVGFYEDVGENSRKQPDLKRLLADCCAGRVDLVVTKSASRISRSLPTLMETVRRLTYSKPPIGLYFEDTALNTLDKNAFLLLTMFEAMSVEDNTAPCSLAQYLKMRGKVARSKKSTKPKEDTDHE
jgi:DNA invertase Pin-like site-specific DNA recombinase